MKKLARQMSTAIGRCNRFIERDCTAVRKLSSAGMILLGKTHTVQFAASINGVNADFGTPHNPWSEIPHLPGGSSSGSAVAVAAGMVPMALGSDTGGSIRLPAALTGITGFKPTSGRLGRGGVRPLAWSLDTIGPLTRSVFDAALVFKVMQGFDSEDETTWTVAPIDSLDEVEKAIKGMRLVVCDTAFFDNCDPDVIKAVEEVAATLSELGATVSRDAIPEIEDAARLKSDGVIFPAEAYAVNQKLYDEHRDAIDPEVRYVAGGKDVSMPAYYWEMRERFHVQSRYVERMKDVDAILAPTSAFPAWPLEKFEAGERPPVAYSRNTMIGNILNLSSISVSCGFTSDGLPIGAMISTRPYDDLKALRLAHAYQHATSWHTKRPDLSWID